MNSAPLPKLLSKYAKNLDHVAIAVPDLETSIAWYRDVLGFKLLERRETHGEFTGMVSAVLDANNINFVLIQGTSPSSQVSRFMEHFGPGVQHLAIRVENLEQLVPELRTAGMEFATSIIYGKGLLQIFTKRDEGSGMMIELIERLDKDGRFTDKSVQELFRQLEKINAY